MLDELVQKGLKLVGLKLSKELGLEMSISEDTLTLSNGRKDLVLEAVVDDYIEGDDYITLDMAEVLETGDNGLTLLADVEVDSEEVHFDSNDFNVIKAIEDHFAG